MQALTAWRQPELPASLRPEHFPRSERWAAALPVLPRLRVKKQVVALRVSPHLERSVLLPEPELLLQVTELVFS